MVRQKRHKGFLRAAWLAAFAILLQALMPVAHHPANMALTGDVAFDLAKNLCIAPGAPAPGDQDQSPAHKPQDCAICQAVHAIGGFAPPASPVIIVASSQAAPPAITAAIAVPQRRPRTGQQPRAPPVTA